LHVWLILSFHSLSLWTSGYHTHFLPRFGGMQIQQTLHCIPLERHCSKLLTLTITIWAKHWLLLTFSGEGLILKG
jgi:hypothetical protein